MYVLYCKTFNLSSCPLGTDCNAIKVFLTLLKADLANATLSSAVRVDVVCCRGIWASLASFATVTQSRTATHEKDG